MKYTKLIVLILCTALALSVVSCKQGNDGETAPTVDVTTENTPVTTVPV